MNIKQIKEKKDKGKYEHQMKQSGTRISCEDVSVHKQQ